MLPLKFTSSIPKWLSYHQSFISQKIYRTFGMEGVLLYRDCFLSGYLFYLQNGLLAIKLNSWKLFTMQWFWVLHIIMESSYSLSFLTCFLCSQCNGFEFCISLWSLHIVFPFSLVFFASNDMALSTPKGSNRFHITSIPLPLAIGGKGPRIQRKFYKKFGCWYWLHMYEFL